MTMTIKAAIKPIAFGDWSGFRISRPDGDLVRSIAVVADGSGRLRAAKAIKDTSDEQLFDNEIGEQDKCAWLWPLLTGKLTGAVCDALNLAGLDGEELAGFEAAVASAVSRLHIDHEAASLLACSGEPKIAHLEFYSGDSDRAQNRRQQAQIYPIFADILASRVQLKMTIDRKDGSLADKLAKCLSTNEYTITPAILKRLMQATHMPEGCDLASVMMVSQAIPPDWLPKGGEEFEAFAHIATAIVENFDNPLDSIATLLKSCGGKWVDQLARIVNAAYPPPRKPKAEVTGAPSNETALAVIEPEPQDEYVPPPPPALAVRYSMQGMKTMVRMFSDNVILPMAAHGQSANEVHIGGDLRAASELLAAKVLLAGRTIHEVADIARRFHQEQYRIIEGSPVLQEERKRYVASLEDGGWPGLTKEVQAPNGLWLVPLKTTPQLQDEGKKLNHCVGGYTAQAERCQSHIVSVRSLDLESNQVESLSTCEITGISGPSGPFNVRQHYTTGNTTPTTAAQQALNWYLAAMESGQVEVNWDLIKLYKETDIKKSDSIERYCQYNWRDPDLLFEATVPWFPAFSKGYKNLDLAGFVDMPDMVTVREIIPPDLMKMRR